MSNPDDHLGFLISDVARLMRTVFDRRVRRLGLTRAQWLALTRLHRRPGASQSELADMMEIEKATVGRLIDRLEAKGWVERRPDPQDSRVRRVYLRNEATPVFMMMSEEGQKTFRTLLKGIDAPAEAALLEGLRRIKANAEGSS